MDPITAVSAAASVVGIAGFAIQLSQVLYEFIDSTRSAKEGVHIVVSSVDATARAMNYVHGFLSEEKENIKREHKPVLFSTQALHDVNETAVKCLILFWRIEGTILHNSPKPKNFETELNKRLNAFNDHLKANTIPPSPLLSSKLKWTMLDSVIWFYISPKLEQYCVQLDRLKLDLVVMFQVISLRKLSQKLNPSPEDMKMSYNIYRGIQKLAGGGRHAPGDLDRRTRPYIKQTSRKGERIIGERIQPNHVSSHEIEVPEDEEPVQNGLHIGNVNGVMPRPKPRPANHGLYHDATATEDIINHIPENPVSNSSRHVKMADSVNLNHAGTFSSNRRASFAESNSDDYCTANEYDSEPDVEILEESPKIYSGNQPQLTSGESNAGQSTTAGLKRTNLLRTEHRKVSLESQPHIMPSADVTRPPTSKLNIPAVSGSSKIPSALPIAQHDPDSGNNIIRGDETSDIYNVSERDEPNVDPWALDPTTTRRKVEVNDPLATTNTDSNVLQTPARVEHQSTNDDTAAPKLDQKAATLNNSNNSDTQKKGRRSGLQLFNWFSGGSEAHQQKLELDAAERNLDVLIRDSDEKKGVSFVFPHSDRAHAMEALKDIMKRNPNNKDLLVKNAFYTGFVIKGSRYYQIPNSDKVALHQVTAISYRSWLKIFPSLNTTELMILEKLLTSQNYPAMLYSHSLHSLRRLKASGFKIQKVQNQALVAVIRSQISSQVELEEFNDGPKTRHNELEARSGGEVRAFKNLSLPPPFPPQLNSAPIGLQPGSGSHSAPPPYSQSGQPGASSSRSNSMTEEEYRDALTTYRAYSIQTRIPDKVDHNSWYESDYVNVISTINERFSRSDIIDRITALQAQGPSAMEKKYNLTPLQQQQVSRFVDLLRREDDDSLNFQLNLVQLEARAPSRKKGNPPICTIYMMRIPRRGIDVALLYRRIRGGPPSPSGFESPRLPRPPPPPHPRPPPPKSPPHSESKPPKQRSAADGNPLPTFSSKIPQSPHLDLTKEGVVSSFGIEKSALESLSDVDDSGIPEKGGKQVEIKRTTRSFGLDDTAMSPISNWSEQGAEPINAGKESALWEDERESQQADSVEPSDSASMKAHNSIKLIQTNLKERARVREREVDATRRISPRTGESRMNERENILIKERGSPVDPAVDTTPLIHIVTWRQKENGGRVREYSRRRRDSSSPSPLRSWGSRRKPPSGEYEFERRIRRQRYNRDYSSDDSDLDSENEGGEDIVHRLLMEWTPAGEGEENETANPSDNPVENGPSEGDHQALVPAELGAGPAASYEPSHPGQDSVMPSSMRSPPPTLLGMLPNDRPQHPSRRAYVEDVDDESSSGSKSLVPD